MVVKKSTTTTAAEALNKQVRSRGVNITSHHLDLKAMAKNLGAASSLPPLAVAAEKQLLDEATKAALAAGDDEASLEKAEEDLFDDDLEAASESEEADDVEFEEAEPEAEPELAPVPVKRKRGRPTKAAQLEMKVAEAEAAKMKAQAADIAPPSKKNQGKTLSTPLPAKNEVKATRYGKTITFALADLLPDVPPRGDFDLNKVRESPYFFS